MDQQLISSYFQRALNLVNPNISNIRRTPSGMTNESYFVEVNGAEYVIRIPGSGTDQLVDRINEKNNLYFGTELGINPELIYFDTDSGVKITKMISSPKTLTKELARENKMMKKIISLLQRLHQSNTVMKNHFELFQLMIHYENLVQEVNPFMLEEVWVIKEDILELQKDYEALPVEEVPCHIDTIPENFIYDTKNETLYLIDWEYSGMFDPMWDIATLCLTLQLTEEEELFFLKHYLERDPMEEEMQRILLHKIFQDYLWALWTLYKEEKGTDYGSFARDRMNRAKKNISIYEKTYNYDNVG